MNGTKESAMNGYSTMHDLQVPEKSQEEHLAILRAQLLSDNPDVQRTAAVCVRTARRIVETARRTNTAVVSMVEGTVVHVDPDSPIIPDYTELLALADRVLPIPNGPTLEDITVRTSEGVTHSHSHRRRS